MTSGTIHRFLNNWNVLFASIVIEIVSNDRNDPRLKTLRKLFIDFYEYSYKSFDPTSFTRRSITSSIAWIYF